eukprot:TRINITY_DN16576_c0_g2_i1.p1 TRINITY_DN16576_c0_g2~~TRINITY_DN16576_c0_g2_i1.p1  ORF type:complete len:679 (-),score=91.60 TRINITY_DN16576_c0_g2_i1:79-2115(-)
MRTGNFIEPKKEKRAPWKVRCGCKFSEMLESAPAEWLMQRCGTSWFLALGSLLVLSLLTVPVLVKASAFEPEMLAVPAATVLFIVVLLVLARCKMREKVSARVQEASFVILGVMMNASTYILIVILHAGADERSSRERNLARFEILFKMMPLLGCRFSSSMCYLCMSLLLDFGVHGISVTLLSDEFTFAHAFLLILITLLMAGLSLNSSRAHLQIFRIEQDLKIEHEGCRAFMNSACDTVLEVSDDGRTILHCDSAFLHYTGCDAVGMGVESFLEEESIRATLERAQVGVPEKIRGSLYTQQGQLDAAIIVVNKGGTAYKQRSHAVFTKGYFVCIQVSNECDIVPPDDRGSPVMRSFNFKSFRADDDAASSKVFQYALEKEDPASLVQLGEKQKWAIKSEHLHVYKRDVLGEGGYGIVHKGSFLGSPVAVKKALGTFDATLVTELQVLRYLRHPNIVLFHGALVDKDASALSLVFELVHGQTLGRFMASRISANRLQPLTDTERLDTMSGIALALRYLHSNLVVHGDVSPNNMFVEMWRDGLRSKIGDFGMSRRLTKSGKVGGVPRWSAPETFSGNGSLTGPSADIFSFGRITSYLITSQIPYEGLNSDEVVDCLRSGIIRLPSFSEQSALACCRDLVAQCLQVSPGKRPSSVDLTDAIVVWRAGLIASSSILPGEVG